MLTDLQGYICWISFLLAMLTFSLQLRVWVVLVLNGVAFYVLGTWPWR